VISSTDMADDPRLVAVDAWLTKNNKNEYGDDAGTMYMGGTPLFDEMTGQSYTRYDYLVVKFPDKPWEKK